MHSIQLTMSVALRHCKMALNLSSAEDMAKVSDGNRADNGEVKAMPLSADGDSAHKLTSDGDGSESGSAEAHPLQFGWSLWHDQPDRNKSWGSDMREVATFETVEEFWAYVSNTGSASVPIQSRLFSPSLSRPVTSKKFEVLTRLILVLLFGSCFSFVLYSAPGYSIISWSRLVYPFSTRTACLRKVSGQNGRTKLSPMVANGGCSCHRIEEIF